jgi:hypothetical protein
MGMANREQLRRDRVGHAMHVMRRVGAIVQTGSAVPSEPGQPLVARLLADTELRTELRHGLSALQHAPDELETL